MLEQLPALILLAPLFGALLIGLIGLHDRRACFPIAFTSLLISLASAIGAGMRAFTDGPYNYFMGGWEEPLGISIVLRVDALNGLLLIAIAVVAVLAVIFTIRPSSEKDTDKTAYFYILFLLLCVGLFGITITGDAFNLFVLIEVSALTSYGLVAIGTSRRCKMAAFHYLLMGTVGASFYLLGVGYLYLKTGSLNIQDINTILTTNATVAQSPAIVTAFILILVGIWIKMAFFPLYGWLPNAYSYSPSGSSCLLAPLMTKVSVYVMIRVMLSLFGLEWVFGHPGWSDLVVWLAVIAILAGSIMALAQREIKRMLCYLIVAEIGYMVGGAWLNDPNLWGLTGASYHILADAMMTLCLFLFAGILFKYHGVSEIGDLGGMFKKMPITSIGFIVGALAMIGVPPTCGFFSKFYLIRGGIEGGHPEYVAALLISSLVNAVLFFRIFEIAYFGKNPAAGHSHDHDHDDHDSHDHDDPGDAVTTAARPSREAPVYALIPLLAAAALIILVGIFNGQIIELIRLAFEIPATVVSNLR
jgi:multicomponent Na+:H+ antiporter subunit D